MAWTPIKDRGGPPRQVRHEALDTSIRETYTVLASTYAPDDIEDLISTMDSFVKLNTDGSRVFSLADPSGKTLFGNLAHAPRSEGLATVAALELRLEGAEQFRLFGGTLDGYRLTVGQSFKCDRINATFDALLRISQIEAGARKLRFQPVDLRQLVLDVVDTYAGVAEDHGQSLLAGRIDEADLDGDSELLTQMLVNLIENAITHCPAGATIAVGLVHCEHDLSLTVADDGREKVFRRLYPLDKSRGTAGSGLGLSLALEGIRTLSPRILSSCCTGTARVAWFDRRESGIEIVTHLRQTNA